MKHVNCPHSHPCCLLKNAACHGSCRYPANLLDTAQQIRLVMQLKLASWLMPSYKAERVGVVATNGWVRCTAGIAFLGLFLLFLPSLLR